MIEKHSNAQLRVWSRGFQYTLTNGYKLSVAFGAGNYCDNRHEPFYADETGYESSNFEVAVFEPNGDMVDLFPAEEEGGFSDQVIGYVPASALPALIQALKFWPVRENFKNSPEVFKGKLHARCHMFRKICMDFMDKFDKETANVQA